MCKTTFEKTTGTKNNKSRIKLLFKKTFVLEKFLWLLLIIYSLSFHNTSIYRTKFSKKSTDENVFQHFILAEILLLKEDDHNLLVLTLMNFPHQRLSTSDKSLKVSIFVIRWICLYICIYQHWRNVIEVNEDQRFKLLNTNQSTLRNIEFLMLLESNLLWSLCNLNRSFISLIKIVNTKDFDYLKFHLYTFFVVIIF